MKYRFRLYEGDRVRLEVTFGEHMLVELFQRVFNTFNALAPPERIEIAALRDDDDR